MQEIISFCRSCLIEGGEIVEEVQSNDYTLEMIVKLANLSGLEMSVTLFVNGTVVTGILIPNYKYFDQVAEALGHFETGELIGEQLRKFSTQFKEEKKGFHNSLDSTKNEIEVNGIGYIHLEKAKVIDGNSFYPEEGTLLRFKIKSVDGFIIGKMGKNPY